MYELILASKSPIRKKMLERANIPFEVIVSDADETPDLSKSFGEQLNDYVMNKKTLTKCGAISIDDAEFLHLEEGKMSTACGMTIEYLQDLISTFTK